MLTLCVTLKTSLKNPIPSFSMSKSSILRESCKNKDPHVIIVKIMFWLERQRWRLTSLILAPVEVSKGSLEGFIAGSVPTKPTNHLHLWEDGDGLQGCHNEHFDDDAESRYDVIVVIVIRETSSSGPRAPPPLALQSQRSTWVDIAVDACIDVGVDVDVGVGVGVDVDIYCCLNFIYSKWWQSEGICSQTCIILVIL